MNEDAARTNLVDRWFELTRTKMPRLAGDRGWPVRFDHCFQRILLDHAAGGPWRDSIGTPAWRNASDRQLRDAVELGERVVAGSADLTALNRQSLRWRGKL